MAHPKRKQSKTRTAKRRTHDKAVEPTIALCPNCGACTFTTPFVANVATTADVRPSLKRLLSKQSPA